MNNALDAILANWRSYLLSWGHEYRDATKFRSGVPQPALNGVVRRGGIPIEEAIAAARHHLEGVPWAWRVGPDEPPDTGWQLIHHGAHRVAESPIMALHLRAPVEVPLVPGLEIGLAEDLKTWVEAYAPSFGAPPDQVPAIAEAETRIPGVTRFEARLNNRVVATAALHENEGVAGLYTITTATTHRGRGIGAALTAATLEHARRRGLRLATLQATPDGEPLYERLGFETVAWTETYTF
ncbi:GNAT family N-acetyltransferase [Paractinoplanes atraurantiacus]|uniref:Acetyltransferase (GNAT) family protein n=1 Tax=Paractinoplanes atraurantiacus TaxID=1036182 RepID=A0A285I4X9_9ACTN|nr:GNAT family N-acetyltransferase [Actinoplanes atraurantiacus]SNY43072.1 Acetyltransferase (GNAT) family protein [Actinoplanes atraurantiacus]